jgi:hypothetical protein
MSAKLIDADMTAIATGADGGSISLAGYTDRPILLKFEDSVGGTITLTAGDRPPAQRVGLGAATVEMPTGRKITLAAADVKYVVLELSRFLQDDMKVLFISSTNTSSCSAFILPKAV